MRNKLLILIPLLFAGVVYAAPSYIFQRTILPETDSTYELGTSTKAWLRVFSDQFCLTGDSCISTWPTGSSGLSTTTPWTPLDLVQVVDNGTVKSIATSTLGLPTFSDLSSYLLTSAFGTYFYNFFSATTTSALPEGSNLYWTIARFRDALLGGENAILGNATTTNATSTNQNVSSELKLSYLASGLLKVTNGIVGLATAGTDYLASYDPFTHETTYSATNSATTSPLWLKGGLNASSTTNISGATADALVSIKQDSVWGSGLCTGYNCYALDVTGYSRLGGFRVNGADGANSLYLSGGQMGFTVDSGQVMSFSHLVAGVVTERIYIDASGRVGIGGIAVDTNSALTVMGNRYTGTHGIVTGTSYGTYQVATLDDGFGAVFNLPGAVSGLSAACMLMQHTALAGSNNNWRWCIGGPTNSFVGGLSIQYAGSSNNLVLSTNGNVGVGNDTTPDFGFEIGSGTFGVSSSASNDGDRLIVNSSRQVGIGTTSPLARLAVSSANATTNFPLFYVSSSSVAVATSTYFAIDSLGNVTAATAQGTSLGVGTTSPYAKVSASSTNMLTAAFDRRSTGSILDVLASGVSKFLVTDSTTTVANVFKVTGCPAGFTYMKLGCMQTAEEGSGDLNAATDDCFDTYGGRLPSVGEMYIGFLNYAFTDETDDEEWAWPDFDNGSLGSGVYAATSFNSGLSLQYVNGYAYSISKAYRCFVPFGASN